MKPLFTLLLALGIAGPGFSQTHPNAAKSGKCDTIITKEGKSYACHILRQNEQEIQFSLCEDTTEKVFVIPNDRVLSVQSSSTHPLKIHKPVKAQRPKKHPKSKVVPYDPNKTQSLRYLNVDVVQVVKKGAAFQFESSFSKRGSLVLNFGLRKHDFISPGTEEFEYTVSSRHPFFGETKTSYSSPPPTDFGDFAPDKSFHIATGLRIYLNYASENSFFVQPGFYLFHHTGVNIQDTKTLLSSNTYSEGLWLPSTNVSQWHVLRTATKSSRTTTGFSFSTGYRVLGKNGLSFEMGLAVSHVYNHANDKLHYYGLSDLFCRPFLSLGWRLP